MKSITSFVLLSVIGILLLMSCVAAAGLAGQQIKDIENVTEAREAEARAEEAEAEAQRAIAEAAKTEQEAREAEARAREAEAEADRLRAEGQRAEALADAYATRRLADEGARAIRRQGRLLVFTQAQLLFFGGILGMSVVVNGILAWVWLAANRQGGSDG